MPDDTGNYNVYDPNYAYQEYLKEINPVPEEPEKKVSVGDRVKLIGSTVKDNISSNNGSVSSKLLSDSPITKMILDRDAPWATVTGNTNPFNIPGAGNLLQVRLDNGVNITTAPSGLSGQIIKASTPSLLQKTPTDIPTILEQLPAGVSKFNNSTLNSVVSQGISSIGSTNSYLSKIKSLVKSNDSVAAGVDSTLNSKQNTPLPLPKPVAIKDDSSQWNVTKNSNGELQGGFFTEAKPSTQLVAPIPIKTKVVSKSVLGDVDSVSYSKVDIKLGQLENVRGVNLENIYTQKVVAAIADPKKAAEILNDDIDKIQNSENFPKVSGRITSDSGIAITKYDYRIDIGDPQYPLMVRLEDRLMEARASFGLPVHGNPDIARRMKYHMYNRFKTPDTNMAYNKTFTHVFFTRPDLNILYENKDVVNQVRNHSDSSIIWRRYPELFPLLVDARRCHDDNNFNLLLSNQVVSTDNPEETLEIASAGKTWRGYEISYGSEFNGREAGELNCVFTETNELSIYSLIKLWMTYIDNVSRGAWKPSYWLQDPGKEDWNSKQWSDDQWGFTDSHVFTKTLDYASSCYIIKCGPDGEDVLYWTKYYGIFPISSGASAFNYELANPVGDTPKLNIRFRYSFKRDMNPISLIEFNQNAIIKDKTDAVYENSYNLNYSNSSRPYVGCPFIETNLADPQEGSSRSTIRLKFKPSTMDDRLIYRSSLTNKITDGNNVTSSNTDHTNSVLGGEVQKRLGGFLPL